MQQFNSLDFAALTAKVWLRHLAAIGNALVSPFKQRDMTTFDVMRTAAAPTQLATPFMGGWKALAEDAVSDPSFNHLPGNAFYMETGD